MHKNLKLKKIRTDVPSETDIYRSSLSSFSLLKSPNFGESRRVRSIVDDKPIRILNQNVIL